jgi:dihydrofolate synthase / folylpolyglutamate synthase
MTPTGDFTYQDALTYLTNQIEFAGSRDGLTNMISMHKDLGSPVDMFDIVHVTGTNGKGSTSAKIAYGLQLAGKKVGLFSSPHLSSFRERIKVNGELISESDFARHMKLLKALVPSPTFFEALTLTAFSYFAEMGVDVAVLEVGVGGVLDSTNICDPVLSVITSIALDHEKYLGGTLDGISREKAGIIKEGIPVVLGARAQTAPILEKAKQCNAPTIFGIMSGGHFDDENNETASLALQSLAKRYAISDEMICKAMYALPRGRFEVMPQLVGIQRGFAAFPPFVLMDVAHNPDAMEHLFRSISLKMPSLPIRTVVALTQDHDAKKILAIVEKHSKVIHPISSTNARVLPIAELEKHLTSTKRIQGVEEAIAWGAEKGEIVLFCGSFYMMAGVREALKFSDPRDPDTHLSRFNNRLKF